MECCLGLWKLAKPRTRCLSTRVEQNKEHRKSIILINLIWVVSCSLKLCFWQHTSVNFVGLDWSGGSNTIDYPRASANCLIAGRAIAYFFHKLRQGGYRGIFFSLMQCDMIWLGEMICGGQSLGSHVCSYAAKYTKSEFGFTLDRVTG